MTIREQMEERELEYLSPYATLSKNSKGRKIKEEECDIRPVFQRDRDRIVHCKAALLSMAAFAFLTTVFRLDLTTLLCRASFLA